MPALKKTEPFSCEKCDKTIDHLYAAVTCWYVVKIKYNLVYLLCAQLSDIILLFCLLFEKVLNIVIRNVIVDMNKHRTLL